MRTRTFGGVIQDSTVGGTGTMAIPQIGGGVETLSRANTYTGGTAVSNGTLAIGATGSLGGGNITVANGTTFSVAAGGSLSNSTALTNNGAVLLQSASKMATLNGTDATSAVVLDSGNLTISGGGTYAGTIGDLIKVAGISPRGH